MVTNIGKPKKKEKISGDELSNRVVLGEFLNVELSDKVVLG